MKSAITFSFFLFIYCGLGIAQYEQNPNYLRNIEQYYQNGLQYTWVSTMDNAFTGKQDDYEYLDNTFRMIYSWDISSIPTNATVSVCTKFWDIFCD